MKKIKLEIEALEIESFDTTAATADKGTVVGHLTGIGEFTCGVTPYDNCWRTEQGTCFAFTCLDTCAFRYTCPNTCAQGCMLTTDYQTSVAICGETP